jgi:hypothetical protein
LPRERNMLLQESRKLQANRSTRKLLVQQVPGP